MNGSGGGSESRGKGNSDKQQTGRVYQNGSASLALPGSGTSSRQDRTMKVWFPDDTSISDEHGPNNSDSSGFWNRMVGIATAMLASICATGLMTILVVLYLTVRPFSEAAYRRLAAQFGAASLLDALVLLLPNIRIIVTGDSDLPSPVGTSLLVSNHVLHTDWWGILMLGRCIGIRGTFKVFLRNDYLNINMHPATSATDAFPPNRANGAIITVASSNKALTRSDGSWPSQYSAFSSTTTSSSVFPSIPAMSSQEVTVLAKLLHVFLDFPLMHRDDSISEREQLFQLLRSLAHSSCTSAPVHLLFFPEGWSIHNGADRNSLLAKSNEFAKREGRPQLRHLLLPRTRGFNACLECLRESNPSIYDVTMAFTGYQGALPPHYHLSMWSLWDMLRRRFPHEIHLRIKRYSLEEVLQDSSWLDKQWAEKDRLLDQFARNQSFPRDSHRRPRVFDTRSVSLESSVVALSRLLLLPCAIPTLLLLSIPLFWTFLFAWLVYRAFRLVFPDPDAPTIHEGGSHSGVAAGAGGVGGPASGSSHHDPNPMSGNGTPYLPATPFATPSTGPGWRHMFGGKDR